MNLKRLSCQFREFACQVLAWEQNFFLYTGHIWVDIHKLESVGVSMWDDDNIDSKVTYRGLLKKNEANSFQTWVEVCPIFEKAIETSRG